jgi:hypothetical protein
MASIFVGGGSKVDYPAYYVEFTLDGNTNALFLANFNPIGGWSNPDSPVTAAEFGYFGPGNGSASDDGAAQAVATYLESIGASSVQIVKITSDYATVTVGA